MVQSFGMSLPTRRAWVSYSLVDLAAHMVPNVQRGLVQMCKRATESSIDDILALPSQLSRDFRIYLCVLTWPDSRLPRLYIGSGKGSDGGVVDRVHIHMRTNQRCNDSRVDPAPANLQVVVSANTGSAGGALDRVLGHMKTNQMSNDSRVAEEVRNGATAQYRCIASWPGSHAEEDLGKRMFINLSVHAHPGPSGYIWGGGAPSNWAGMNRAHGMISNWLMQDPSRALP